MKKKGMIALLVASMCIGALTGCGGAEQTGGDSAGEGKVINIYSWNDEFRERVEAVYPEVESTSEDGTVTTLKDGTEIHWIVNPNQDGVYQQKLDEALLNQANAAADDKVDIFLSETDYVNKYTDADADVAAYGSGDRSGNGSQRSVWIYENNRFRCERGAKGLYLAMLSWASRIPPGYCDGCIRYG